MFLLHYPQEKNILKIMVENQIAYKTIICVTKVIFLDRGNKESYLIRIFAIGIVYRNLNYLRRMSVCQRKL
jgi:hypothetical protein